MNRAVPEWVVGKILVLGLAYKKNVDDVRESPAAHAKLLVETRGRYWKGAGNIACTLERMQDR